MASRGKKKQAEQSRPAQAAAQIPEKSANRPDVWVWIMLAAIVAAFAFSFVPSYTVQATVDLDLGDEGYTPDEDSFYIGADVLDILFVPATGYDGAAEWLVAHFPATENSETMQDIARAYLQTYPASLLEQLDSAFVAIYAIEVALCAVTVAYAVAFVVMLSVKKGDKRLQALVFTAVACACALIRLIFAIAIYSQSTKEFVLTAGGGAWLTFLSFAIATACAAIAYFKKRKKEAAAK